MSIAIRLMGNSTPRALSQSSTLFGRITLAPISTREISPTRTDLGRLSANPIGFMHLS